MPAVVTILLCCTAMRVQPGAAVQTRGDIVFYGDAKSPISAGVIIPPGRAMLWTSGTVPPLIDKAAPQGSANRYGDTKTQAAGVLRAIESQLKAQGLGLSDVIYLRVYVVPDANKGGKPDFAGWFEAYAQFFGNDTNPTKVARSTIAVPALVNPDWLIEIEAVAVYPAKGSGG
ncbi:MAG: RidA family protein [Tepidisphaeraceae bacterium]